MFDATRFLTPTLKPSFIQRIDPRVKLISLVTLSIVTISVDRPLTLILFFLLTMAGYPLARIPLRNIKILAVLLLLLIWGTVYSQALFYQEYPRTILFTILPENALGLSWKGLHVYREGIEYGALQSMRFAATTALALLFYWTTNPNAMLFGLIRLKAPYGLAFMVITSLRFIPLLVSEALTVIRAQRLKAYKPFQPANWLKTVFLVLIPILSNCIRRSAKLAVSVEGRAFVPNASRTHLNEDMLALGPLDRVILTLCVLALPVVIFKILFWLYENDLYYLSELRWIYDIARHYI
jgi:energy-coupling factor transport system permease protein